MNEPLSSVFLPLMLSLIASKEDATVNIFHCFSLLQFGSTLANLTVFKEKLFLTYLLLKLILGHFDP